MNSNLPVEVLGKIWELSDHDKDGALDSEEFAVVMNYADTMAFGRVLCPSIIPAG